jgi:hypothetical protein
MYLTLIELGIQFLLPFISSLKGGKAPAEIIQAIQAAVDALLAHKSDIISKSNIDALRG